MPLRNGEYIPMETLPLERRELEDKYFQAHWYHHIGNMASGLSVLDVGSGTGYGLKILRSYNIYPYGIDIAICPSVVQPVAISDVASEAWDWVVALDVIEHVQNDVEFLNQLLRVAIKNVFFSTPNWNQFHCTNPHHIREYSPVELRNLVSGLNHRLWVSDAASRIYDIPILYDDEMAANFGVLITK